MSSESRPSGFRIWFEAARPRTLPAAVAPVLVGSALAGHESVFQLAPALLCLGFALLVQVGTNFANDYYDFVQGADTGARVGPRRAVAAGLVSPGRMKRAMILVFVGAFALGLGLVVWGGPWLLLVGISSILCGIAYTGGPFPLAYRGLGDVFVFLFFGLVAVGGTYFVQAGRLTLDSVLAGVPIGLLAANILVVNNYRDVETDAVAGKRTLVVRFGRGAARAQFAVSWLVALLVPVGLWWARGLAVWTLLPLLLAPLAWSHFTRLRRSQTPFELIVLLGDTGRVLAGYAVLFAIGIAVG